MRYVKDQPERRLGEVVSEGIYSDAINDRLRSECDIQAVSKLRRGTRMIRGCKLDKHRM